MICLFWRAARRRFSWQRLQPIDQGSQLSLIGVVLVSLGKWVRQPSAPPPIEPCSDGSDARPRRRQGNMQSLRAGRATLSQLLTVRRHHATVSIVEHQRRLRFQRQVNLCHLLKAIRNFEMRVRYAAAAVLSSLAFAGSVSQAEIYLPPCHSLTLSVSPETECFDDVDRDGVFKYTRGDRIFDAKGWIQYKWNLN